MSAYMTREGDWLLLSVPSIHLNQVRKMAGLTWDHDRKKFIIKKPNATIFTSIKNVVPDLVIHADVEPLIKEITIKKEAINNMKEAGWDSIEPRQPMPLKEGIVPFQHQKAGYEIACRILGL